MTDTILVTGASGKTGRRLIPLLVRRGATVRAASRNASLDASRYTSPEAGGDSGRAADEAPGVARRGVESVRFDWADPGTYEAARKGVDAIYVVVGDFATPGDPAEQVRALLDGAAESGVRRVVLLSALGGDQASPDNPLRRVEVAVESSGIPGTVLRPAAFMQNFSEPHWNRYHEGIRDRDEIFLPGGDGRMSWVSTEDIAAVAAAALTEDGHEGKGYAITGPEPLTMAEVAARISAAAGRTITYREAGREDIRADMLAAGVQAAFVDQLSDFYIHALTSGDYGVLSDDVLTATGRAPVTFAEFAAVAAPAWRR